MTQKPCNHQGFRGFESPRIAGLKSECERERKHIQDLEAEIAWQKSENESALQRIQDLLAKLNGLKLSSGINPARRRFLNGERRPRCI